MEVKNVQVPDLEHVEAGAKLNPRALGDIPVQVTVELGRSQMSLRDILELSEGSIVELDRLAGEPLDLKVGDQLIAQGEVVVIEENFGIRITHLVTPEERARPLR